MGWTVLYFAFGVVALWLLSEVLLQYKARLRWRLLAFFGFSGVVAGVAIPSVAVIIAGAAAFAVGQVYVTLSFRRGFSEGWAIRRPPAGATPGAEAAGRAAGGSRAGRRRGKGERGAARAAEPAPRSAAPADPPPAPLAEGPDAPDTAAAPAGLMPNVPEQPTVEHADYGSGYGQYAAAAEETTVFGGQFDYGQGQYAAYSDPYIGSRPQTYEPYEGYGQQQYESYVQQQPYHPGDTYAPQHYDMDTPPGGVWVPQQRDTDLPPPPQQQPAPGGDYDGQQYRY